MKDPPKKTKKKKENKTGSAKKAKKAKAKKAAEAAEKKAAADKEDDQDSDEDDEDVALVKANSKLDEELRNLRAGTVAASLCSLESCFRRSYCRRRARKREDSFGG